MSRGGKGGKQRSRHATYVKYGKGPPAAGFRVALPEGDELFREALGLFRLWPGRGDGLVCEERGDEVAEERLAVRGVAGEVPVFGGAAGAHCVEGEGG